MNRTTSTIEDLARPSGTYHQKEAHTVRDLVEILLNYPMSARVFIGQHPQKFWEASTKFTLVADLQPNPGDGTTTVYSLLPYTPNYKISRHD